MRNLKRLSLLVLSALPMLAGSDGAATITYVPLAGTPTLSETMLIALALLLPVVAFKSMRSVKGGRTFAAMFVAAGLLTLEAISGFHMLPRAQAIVGFTLSAPAGGSVGPIGVNDGFPQTVTNTSGVSMLLQSVTWQYFTMGAQAITGSGRCQTGVVIANAGTCTLAITAPNIPGE